MPSPNMTYFDVANLLDGVEYGEEDRIFKDLWKVAKDNRLVVVFGASDDLVELRGVIDEEFGAWNGTTLWLNAKGDMSTHKSDLKDRGLIVNIRALWCEEPEISWTFETDIPHATFTVYEDDEKFCRGIVFSLDYLLSNAGLI